jgi:hypothetical protein
MNIKKYFIAGLLVMGAQDKKNNKPNQQSPGMSKDGNASNSSEKHLNSAEDNRKDARYYGDPSTSKKMKSPDKNSSSGRNKAEGSASVRKTIPAGSPDPDAVER